ncbi:MAG: NAD-dependent epimerase/dehydratase family protein, partial [Nitrososphaerota archaeon]|nr:NAD-dependent epimerase/dehydratase family protein [Nitrososphaerota archaeon]
MVYMVIGGTGFIGPYVVKELVDRGEEVVAADWMPDPTGLGHLGLDKKVRVIKVDILDYQSLLGAVKANGITHIANLANARELTKLEPKEVRAARGGGWV